MTHNPMLVALTIAALCACLEAQTFRDDFRAPNEKKWDVVAGDWELEEGGWVQRKNDGGYCYALAKTDFEPRSIEFEATPLERNKHDFCSIAAVVKYADKKNYMIVRLGSYSSMSFMYWVDGERKIANLGSLVFVPEEKHSVKVMLKKDKIAVFLDGKLRFILRDTMPGAPARFGIFTECHCRFDNVTIKGKKETDQ